MKTPFKAALLALNFATTPAFAEPIRAADRAAITARVVAFDTAFRGSDVAAVCDCMPDNILSNLAAQSGLLKEALKAAMKDPINIAFETVTVDGFGMAMEAANWKGTPDGSSSYAMIPTMTEMTVEGAAKMRSASDTLAFTGVIFAPASLTAVA